MAIPKKTFYSPYITHSTAGDLKTVEGTIDLVKVTGTNAADGTEADRGQATLTITGSGLDAEVYEVLAGDVLEGPFTKVVVTAIVDHDGHTDVMIYERDKTIVG